MLRNVEKQAGAGMEIIKGTARDLQFKEMRQLIQMADSKTVYDALMAAFYMGVNVGHGMEGHK